MNPLKRNNPGVRATDHEDRIQTLERRLAEPELEYAVAILVGPGTINNGVTSQLTMNDDEYPLGQYPTDEVSSPPVRGYSIIDDYIQCNEFGYDGYWHLFASYTVNVNAPATPDLTQGILLGIEMELWDTTGAFVSTYQPFWTLQAVDNRTSYAADTLYLRTQTMFFNGGIFADERARFKASVSNNSGSNIQGDPGTFTVIRYGNAAGQITAGGG